MAKIISKRLNKICSICGKKIKVILYKNRTCRSGHYFGKVPIHKIKDFDGIPTKTEKIAGFEVQVFVRDPKPRGFFEYWECPKCYWEK